MPETLIFTTTSDQELGGDDVLAEGFMLDGAFIQLSEHAGSTASVFLTKQETLALADQLYALANRS